MKKKWIFIVPLAIGGLVQGIKLHNGTAFAEVTQATLFYFRISTTGLLFMVLGNLLFALNIFALTLKWKLTLFKNVIVMVKAPLEVSPGFDVTRRRDQGGLKA